jgi:hypothetical protein
LYLKYFSTACINTTYEASFSIKPVVEKSFYIIFPISFLVFSVIASEKDYRKISHLNYLSSIAPN